MKDEKKLKEMMASEKSDHDDVDMEIEELKAEIDRMIKGLSETSPEEKVIMEKIRKVFNDHGVKYSYDESEPKYVEVGFCMENKPFKIHVILQNGKVIFRLSFPFRVQSNAYPLVCMFMAEFNENKAFAHLSINPDGGELTMEYSYMLEKSSQFDEKYFWVYMTSLVHPTLGIYTKAAQLSVGMVSGKDRRHYKKLLEMALETVDGEYDDDNVNYGIESLKLNSDLDPLHLFEEDGEDDKDISESDDEDIMAECNCNMREKMGTPSFEEFVSMKEQAEKDNEEESKDRDSVLSMFAKKAEGKETKGIGEIEDE